MGTRRILENYTFSLTALVAALFATTPVWAALPLSLRDVPVPEPANLAEFVQDKPAAIRLGKALFWDMQVGSDGMTACASCHFHAGTDNRAHNTLHAGPNGRFEGGGQPNGQLTLGDFPFRKLVSPEERGTGGVLSPAADPAVISDRDDVVGSQGVNRTRLERIVPGRAEEPGRTLRDANFTRYGRNVRQVTGRNAPTVINAVFNFANFWDGRANHIFNGVDPFGIMNTEARVYINNGNALTALNLTEGLGANPFALNNASLASQAVGPPLNDVEMSWVGRSWPEVGRKMLPLRPLAKQEVHATDSSLAALRHGSGKGLATTYDAMIRAAFQPVFWNSATPVNGYSQMETNFTLFFGLALQLYQATLISDQTPFDSFLQGERTAMTASQVNGMNIFFSGGAACANCHIGPELTGASVSLATDPEEPGLIELMSMGDGRLANYDIGYYNIGVRPTAEDKGRGGRVALNGIDMPLSFTGQHFERQTLPFAPLGQPGCINNFFADPPNICPSTPDAVTRQAVDGAFKTPGLRNVELTGPYFHNGGAATLRQTVDFYIRGGDFHEANMADLDPFVDGINGLKGTSAQGKVAELIDFLLALTDERVRWEKAPFDHPQLMIANGHLDRIEGDPKRTRVLADNIRVLPAIGAAGRQAQGLPPLKPFLADSLEGQALADFHFQN